jgi:pilus assembly protein CpaB
LKASTLFSLTVALLLGLAVAVTAKFLGIFERPPAPPPPEKVEVQALVASHNLFENFVLQPSDVRTRPLRPDELAHYEEHKDEYLPAVASAVALRVVKKNVLADQPILKSTLQEMALADPIHERLGPSMRAVNVAVGKDQSAGGLIQPGDYVDVFLTSTIEWGDHKTTQTVNLARNVRVIVKRNMLWKVLAVQPDDKSVNFTLEANPYRAALIEFSKDKGRLSLVPISVSEQRKLADQRKALLKGGNGVAAAAFGEEKSNEYRDEDTRVAAFLRGDLVVGQSDLIRIFNLQTPPPPVAPKPPKKPVTVQFFTGVEHTANVIFGPDGRTEVLAPGRSNGRIAQVSAVAPVRPAKANPRYNFDFSAPGARPCPGAT